MLADKLANEGVVNKDKDSRHPWEFLPARQLREDCSTLANADWGSWLKSADTENRDGQDNAHFVIGLYS